MKNPDPSLFPEPSGPFGSTDQELSEELRKWTGATPALNPVGELLDRHWEAAFAYARLCTAGPNPAGMLTTQAFTRLFGQSLRRTGPTAAWRPRLLVTVRRIAGEWGADHRREMLHPELRAAAGAGAGEGVAASLLPPVERRLLSRAFQRLPQPAAALLWHTEVEAEPPAAPARLLGFDEAGARVELGRARERLREECLQVHRELATEQDCLRYFRLLDVTYRRGGIDVDPDLRQHLAGCTHCRHTAGQLAPFNSDLGTALAEGVLGWRAREYRVLRLAAAAEPGDGHGHDFGAAPPLAADVVGGEAFTQAVAHMPPGAFAPREADRAPGAFAPREAGTASEAFPPPGSGASSDAFGPPGAGAAPDGFAPPGSGAGSGGFASPGSGAAPDAFAPPGSGAVADVFTPAGMGAVADGSAPPGSGAGSEGAAPPGSGAVPDAFAPPGSGAMPNPLTPPGSGAGPDAFTSPAVGEASDFSAPSGEGAGPDAFAPSPSGAPAAGAACADPDASPPESAPAAHVPPRPDSSPSAPPGAPPWGAGGRFGATAADGSAGSATGGAQTPDGQREAAGKWRFAPAARDAGGPTAGGPAGSGGFYGFAGDARPTATDTGDAPGSGGTSGMAAGGPSARGTEGPAGTPSTAAVGDPAESTAPGRSPLDRLLSSAAGRRLLQAAGKRSPAAGRQPGAPTDEFGGAGDPGASSAVPGTAPAAGNRAADGSSAPAAGRAPGRFRAPAGDLAGGGRAVGESAAPVGSRTTGGAGGPQTARPARESSAATGAPAGGRSARRTARRAARNRNLAIAAATVSGLVVLPLAVWSALGPGDGADPAAGGRPGGSAAPSGTASPAPAPTWAGTGAAGKTTLRGRLHNAASGLCVGIVGGKAVAGAETGLAACSAQPGQQWAYETDGLLRSGAAPGLCLDSHLGYSVQLAPCVAAGAPGGRNIRYDFTLQGTLVPRFDQDLALTPAATDGAGALVLKTRAKAETQRWSIDTPSTDLRMDVANWATHGVPRP
ncbi:ricin-type beta-trefoil lectin domain protein [Streptomyces sennicomposti]